MGEGEGLIIEFSSRFERAIKHASPDLDKKIAERIRLFQHYPRHIALDVHPLSGAAKGYWAFRVNPNYRIIFRYIGENRVRLEFAGNHDIYDRL